MAGAPTGSTAASRALESLSRLSTWFALPARAARGAFRAVRESGGSMRRLGIALLGLVADRGRIRRRGRPGAHRRARTAATRSIARTGATRPPTSRRPCRPSSTATTTSARACRDPALASSPHHQCGQKGAAVDLAWGITRGRPDVRIAVLDSGIKWRDAGAMRDLADRAYLNRGEVAPPCATPSGDCNGDGRFSIADFGAIADRNGNGLADPEDLILDPALHQRRRRRRQRLRRRHLRLGLPLRRQQPARHRQLRPRHRRGRGLDRGRQRCRRRRHVPALHVHPGARRRLVHRRRRALRRRCAVRARLRRGGDPGGARARSPTRARRSRRSTRRTTRRAGDRVDGRRSVEAPEPAGGSLEHTLAVNSVRDTGAPRSYLALNGCTNYGGRTFLSIPSSSCSSEATGHHERRRRSRDERGARPRHHAVDERDPPTRRARTPTTSTSPRRTRSTRRTTSCPVPPCATRAGPAGTRPTATAG